MLPSVQKFQQVTLPRQAQFPRSNVIESPVVPGGGGEGTSCNALYGEAPAELGTFF